MKYITIILCLCLLGCGNYYIFDHYRDGVLIYSKCMSPWNVPLTVSKCPYLKSGKLSYNCDKISRNFYDTGVPCKEEGKIYRWGLGYKAVDKEWR